MKNGMKRYALFIAKWTSILGIVLGLVESVFGNQILIFIGNKSSYVVLGFITMILSSMILITVLYAKTHSSLNNDQKVGVIFGIILPTGICFTTIGMLWYFPGTLLILSALGLSYNYWGKSLKLGLSYKNKKLTLSGLLSFVGIILILVSLLFGILNQSISLFHSNVLLSNHRVSYDILPIDFIRVIDTSNMSNPIIYNESLPVMFAYIFFIIGEVIFIFSSFLHSVVFKKVALIIILMGLLEFVVLLPKELKELNFPISSLLSIYSNLGLGYWIIVLGFIIIWTSTFQMKSIKQKKCSYNSYKFSFSFTGI